MQRFVSSTRNLLATTLSLGALSASAATMTSIQPPAAGEASHAEILGSIFGGTFASTGLDFTNGVITAERVDDDADQLWAGDLYATQAQARYAKFAQSFGYLDESDAYTNLFDVVGYGTSVSGDAALASDGPIRFARDGSEGIRASTRPSDNTDGLDHVITYRINAGPGIEETYVLFFEDRDADSPRADFDYNDLVVTVTRTTNIPEPGALALIGLGGAMILGRRRRG